MTRTSKVTKILAAGFALCMLPGVLWAYPGALNLIPTTDIIGANTLRLSYEADGKNQPYDDGYSEYIYTQYGIGDKLEVGLDIYDVDGSSDRYFNAKYLVVPEGEQMPAIAVGTMFVGEDSKPSYYAVGSRTFGQARFHGGLQTQSDRTWGLLGFDYAINDKLALLADYQTGTGCCHTLGLYWEQSPEFGVTLYLVRNNTPELRVTDDYVGLNLAYTVSL